MSRVSAILSPRAERRQSFLETAGWGGAGIAPLAGDASNRRYDRLSHSSLGRAVLMDAPPITGEDVRPFVSRTKLLRQRGFSAPEILAEDHAAGFLLLEDLGDDLYAPLCAAQPDMEPVLYAQAVDLLAALHRRTPTGDELAPYDMAALQREAGLATHWWRAGLLGPNAELDAALAAEIDAACADVALARDAMVLRDYHAENLIWRPERAGAARVGLLDYQDALIGHCAYDLVSLLEDARRDVAADLAEAMLARFEAASPAAERAEFRAAYATLGAQRNLKIIGVFARLWLRDGKDRYLAHLPRVWGYLQRDLAHPALASLRRFVADHIPAPTPERLKALRALSTIASAPEPTHGLDTAMVLAAGLGARMRPLTDHTPKPLLRVGGRALLDHAIDRAAEIGAQRCVVNAHHLGDQIRAHLVGRARPDMLISDETDMLLETGGGVAKALPLIDRDVFFCVNSDNLWLGPRAFASLLAAWRPDEMDALLLLTPIELARGGAHAGDFFLDAENRLSRRGAAEGAPFVFTGAQIIKRIAFPADAMGAFSLNRVWDALIDAGGAFGCAHMGGWIDVGTPAGLEIAEQALCEGALR